MLNGVKESESDALIVTLMIIKILAEKAGFRGCSQSLPWRLSVVIGCKPTF